jgi:hypothetical protein
MNTRNGFALPKRNVCIQSSASETRNDAYKRLATKEEKDVYLKKRGLGVYAKINNLSRWPKQREIEDILKKKADEKAWNLDYSL